MGMFDVIRCEVMLPDASLPENREFQTKSLENIMASYVITQKGELYEERWEYKWIKDSGSFFGGYSRKIEDSYRREYLTDFHGDIIFYDGRPMDKENNIWRDYYARFTEGKLSRMWYEDVKI